MLALRFAAVGFGVIVARAGAVDYGGAGPAILRAARRRGCIGMSTQYQQPDLVTQFSSGDRPIGVYSRNVVFETQKPGKLDARRKPDGSSETP